MKIYYLTIPITGIIDIEIEAENEEEATQKAFDEISLDQVAGWQAHENITQGNVFYGMQNSLYIEEMN